MKLKVIVKAYIEGLRNFLLVLCVLVLLTGMLSIMGFLLTEWPKQIVGAGILLFLLLAPFLFRDPK